MSRALIPSGDPRVVKRLKMKEIVAIDNTAICNCINLGFSSQVDRVYALTVNTTRGCPQRGVHLFCVAW